MQSCQIIFINDNLLGTLLNQEILTKKPNKTSRVPKWIVKATVNTHAMV